MQIFADTRIRLLVLAAAAACLRCAAAPAPVPPDLTRDSQVDRSLTYNLGPTGLRGWIYTKAATFLDSQQGRTTTASRQILVTHVGAGTPADGVLKVDDVILGVDGKPFADDARQCLGRAITEAEKTVNQGALKLLVWRGGKTANAQLKLRVMGAYSGTAPYDCPKSKAVFEDACRVLAKEPLREDIWGAVSGLALLAAGKPEFLPKVQACARAMARATPKLEPRRGLGMVVWDWGYKGLFLSEYYLLTGDKEVLPAIREYAVTLAKGQSLYGTFGHGLADLTPDGQLHGSIPPYGPVNQAGLIGNLAIIMGKTCGVADPEVDAAIGRALRFFGYYVDKGAVPYGEHMPWPCHENNGKSALTAILFSAGNKPEAARFFAKMSTAAYANREYGHTGQGFSYLWGALGANVGGPRAAAAFFREAAWHFDLERRCDGSFVYDGGEQYGPGKTDDNTYFGKSSYNGLSPTASYVLTYSLPLKKLIITGRAADPALWLSAKEVAEAVSAGRFDVARKAKTTAELMLALGDWSPVVRGWAAEELAARPEAPSLVPRLIALAEGRDAHLRQGACETLGNMRRAEALPVLVRLLTHEDRWLRVKAANALKNMGDQAKPAVPDMLKALVKTAEPLQPIVWDDPIQLTHGELAAALFKGLLRQGVKDVDPALLYPAIRAISRNADGMARATLRDLFENRLTAEDVQALGPDILAAVQVRCPADTMFGNEIRMGGFKALAKYHFKEGVAAGVQFAKTQGGHGSESRTGEIMKHLVSYGAAARECVPALRELIDELNAQCQRGEFPKGELNNRRVTAVEEAIKAIEAATAQPELRSLSVQPGGLAAAAAPSAPAKGPVKVFVLAGQSNMEGQAVVDLAGKDYNEGRGTLAELMRDPAKFPMLKNLKDATGQWAVRDDVWVRYQRENRPLLAGPLKIGYAVYGGTHHFGPELQFGHVVGDALAEPVLLVKTAWGGKSLYKDFRPPSSGGETGPYYKKMIEQVREALASIKQDVPGSDGRYELAGFVWYHGWNDGCEPKTAVPEYEQNLVNLILDVRKEWRAPRLPVVIGELTGPWVEAPGTWDTLRKAQAAAARRPELAPGTVAFVATHDFVRKPEESPNTSHGHHEFGNAETCFLVGDALGKGMLGLLALASGAHAAEAVSPPARPALWAVYYAWYDLDALKVKGKYNLWQYEPSANAPPVPRSKAAPLIGYYDSRDKEVVRWHLRLAKAAGIDALLVSWWGGANVSGKAFEQVVLPMAAQEGVQVALCSELAQFHADVKKLVKETAAVLLRSKESPAYLRIDGKPALYLYQVPFAPKLTPQSFAELRQGVEAEAGPVYWVMDKVSNAGNRMTVPDAWLDIPEIPMYGFYGTFSIKRVWRYEDLIADYRRVADAAHAKGKRIFLPAHPGHDNSGFRPNDNFVMPREEGATLRGYLRAAADAGADAILVTSFNEWPETTVVEPSSSWPDPYGYLKILAEWKGLAFAPPAPPR
jgi:hypothetical protein